MESQRNAAVATPEGGAPVQDVRHLTDTIAVLREAVEKARVDRDNYVRETLATARGDIAMLRETATALRELLEDERNAREGEVQEALREAHEEIHQLKAALAALRESLATDSPRS